ncbi:hypothetical protein Bca52824_090727 [Brassica carinata]|uniref:Gnk2-homologous domain-containing protein n=1 Tax=Brassica carinata TaxID=52824 RepID=A0A8X7NUM1_BRACI|nr:hypothetical protein Bca52824_090727 [Brassica carinata]
MDDLFVVFDCALNPVLVSADICFERNGFFTPNSTYDLNRRLILSSLPSDVTANDAFYTTTGQDPNRAYGLGMCVPGTDARSCSDCIISSSARLLRNCTNQTEGIDWRMDRTLCLVRYSNRSFYGSLGIEILRSENYTRDVQANMTDLEITWEALMIGLIDQASSLPGTRKLESSISHVYSVVQCSKDVSIENCTHCLQQNVIEYRSCCRGRQGGIISRPSCFTRWEVYPFLDLFDNIAPEKGLLDATVAAGFIMDKTKSLNPICSLYVTFRTLYNLYLPLVFRVERIFRKGNAAAANFRCDISAAKVKSSDSVRACPAVAFRNPGSRRKGKREKTKGL